MIAVVPKHGMVAASKNWHACCGSQTWHHCCFQKLACLVWFPNMVHKHVMLDISKTGIIAVAPTHGMIDVSKNWHACCGSQTWHDCCFQKLACLMWFPNMVHKHGMLDISKTGIIAVVPTHGMIAVSKNWHA